MEMRYESGIDVQISQAANRWGHVDHLALRRLGLARSTIADRCRTGKLIREHVGVYSVGHRQTSPLAVADAAVLACGDRSALGHDSAAALYGLRRWPAIPEVISALQHRRPGIRTHRSSTLTRADITVRHGIRVTTPARTIADIAPRLTDEQLVRVIHEARRNGDLPPGELKRLLARCVRAARLVDPGVPPSESALDDAFRAMLKRFHVPPPEFQVDFHGHRVDGIWWRQRLIVELDGGRDHGEWDRIEQDHVRDMLALEYGFQTIRITWRMVTEHPRRLATQLLRILEQRDPDRLV
jgi:very-short-patch-repair endonuclease